MTAGYKSEIKTFLRPILLLDVSVHNKHTCTIVYVLYAHTEHVHYRHDLRHVRPGLRLVVVVVVVVGWARDRCLYFTIVNDNTIFNRSDYDSVLAVR